MLVHHLILLSFICHLLLAPASDDPGTPSGISAGTIVGDARPSGVKGTLVCGAAGVAVGGGDGGCAVRGIGGGTTVSPGTWGTIARSAAAAAAGSSDSLDDEGGDAGTVALEVTVVSVELGGVLSRSGPGDGARAHALALALANTSTVTAKVRSIFFDVITGVLGMVRCKTRAPRWQTPCNDLVMLHGKARASIAPVVATACSSPPSDVVRIPPPVTAPRSAAAVPAGTELTIALVDELSTEWSVPGQLFRAVLVDDLAAASGVVVVRAGTLVYGVVNEVRSSGEPLLALDIPAVKTTSGAPARFETRLKDTDDALEHDVVLTANRRAGAIASPNAAAHYDPVAKRIRIGAGGRLRLVLTEPLTP